MFPWSGFDKSGSSDKFCHELDKKELPKESSPLLSWLLLRFFPFSEPRDTAVDTAAAALS